MLLIAEELPSHTLTSNYIDRISAHLSLGPLTVIANWWMLEHIIFLQINSVKEIKELVESCRVLTGPGFDYFDLFFFSVF